MDALDRARQVFRVEIEAIEGTMARLDDGFRQAVVRLAASSGRVVITGLGKSGLVGRKIAATMSSTGTPAIFLHPVEAVHGDLGVITAADIVIAISHSGESEELLRLLPIFRELGAAVITVTGVADSSLACAGEINLFLDVPREADCFNLAPTASTTALLVLGDALALCVQEAKGFKKSDYALRHPAGEIGRRLALLVDEVMLPADRMPTVPLDAPLAKALAVMCRDDAGLAVVLETSGRLAGIVTDGDLRRLLVSGRPVDGVPVHEVMTRSPKTIARGASAAAAVREMEKHEITCLVVLDRDRYPAGLVHLHGVLGGKELFAGDGGAAGRGPRQPPE